MRVVIQKVLESSVTVNGDVVGEIGNGLMVLVGFNNCDTLEIITKMVDKVMNLRIFDDGSGKMNLSLLEVGGSILSISQFTLYADCKKGRRPSFISAAPGETAIVLYEKFNETLNEKGVSVVTGVFGADMKVSLINDGPVTIILDSENIF